jgi:sugar (pentulose or hexulose) kinase
MTTAGARRVGVIDIGKTNAKVAVVDMGSLAEIAMRSRPNTVLRGDPYPHYDVGGLWTFILDALEALNREHPIDAIAVTTHGATCALLDGQGQLALPILDYEHDGPDERAAEYDAIRPAFAETGSPRLPGGLNLGAQIHWQERRFPEAFARTAAIVIYPQYWSFRLSGALANEITSLGCHTDLWSPAAGDYASLVDRLGWRARFAPLRKASDRLGPILPEIATRTGLRADTQVHCGIHDSNASLLPHLLSRRPPFAVVSTGTWVVAMAIGASAGRLDPERDTLINVNMLGEPVPSARFMGGREHAVLTHGLESRATAADAHAVLADGAMLLPSVQAGSGPFPDRKAEWRGDSGIPPGQRHAAISFYLAMMTAVCLELIGADGPTVAEGPLARNELYIRMLSAATGRSVLVSAAGSLGTSMGAALLASPGILPPSGDTRAVSETDPLWTSYARRWREAADAS